MAMQKATCTMIRSSVFVISLCLIALAAQFAAFAQEGTLEWDKITSPALEGNLLGDPATRSFAIYLPPSYETSDKRFPVFYILHGSFGNAESMINIRPTLDVMIRKARIGEMIAVFVDGSNKLGGSQYRSSITVGDYETYIVEDLVNYVDSNYMTIAHRNSRGITGMSMGGYGAMHLALKYPEAFGVVVAQSGRYDYDTGWWKDSLKAMAFANPKDWEEYNQMNWVTQIRFAYSATVSPNPDKPPLFLDKPFELVDGKAQIVPEAWENHLESDIVHGHLDRYLEQPLRLNSIMFVHGTSDNVTPVEQARALDKAMTELGIDHLYDEHGGGHTFIPDKSLQFLSDHLAGIEFLAEDFAVESASKLEITWGRIRSN